MTEDLQAINTLSDRFLTAVEDEDRSSNFGDKILLLVDDDLLEEGEKILRLYEAEQSQFPDDTDVKESLANHLFRLGYLYYESLYPRALQLQTKAVSPISPAMFSSPEIAHRCCLYMHKSYELLPKPHPLIISAGVFQMVGFNATALQLLEESEQAAIAFNDEDLLKEAKANTLNLKAEGLISDPPLGKADGFPRIDTPGLVLENQSAPISQTPSPSPSFSPPPQPLPISSAAPSKSGGCMGVLIFAIASCAVLVAIVR